MTPTQAILSWSLYAVLIILALWGAGLGAWKLWKSTTPVADRWFDLLTGGGAIK